MTYLDPWIAAIILSLCIPLAPLGYPNRLPVLHGHTSVNVLVTINCGFRSVGIPIPVTAINRGSYIIVFWRDTAEREISLGIRLGGAQILLVARRAVGKIVSGHVFSLNALGGVRIDGKQQQRNVLSIYRTELSVKTVKAWPVTVPEPVPLVRAKSASLNDT